ncbi:hypothetical protein PV326_011751, partial [Microctonus aethiopoides]
MYDKKISENLIESMKSAYKALLSIDSDTTNDSLIATWEPIVDKQTSTQHGQLFENPIVKNVVKSLKVRNKFRNVVLTLSDELQKIYLDIEGNVVLYDEYLEEVTTVQESNECDRVGIVQNKYAEVLRLFLENSALDWYNVFVKQNSLLNWEAWNNAFIDTFSAQSWIDIAYAYNFKFYNGSLLGYALKKRRLLLEVDDGMSTNTQINMIVISLPNFIQN